MKFCAKVEILEFLTRNKQYFRDRFGIVKIGLFGSYAKDEPTRNDALKLCEKLLELVNHQQKQAELGYKFPFGKHPAGKKGNYQLYHNDIILAYNTILIRVSCSSQEKMIDF